jgi:hypothetical protein
LENKGSVKKGRNGRKVTKPKADGKVKVTLYIRQDQIEAIEEIQLSQRKKTGRKPDKQDLIQEAVDLLVKAYRS